MQRVTLDGLKKWDECNLFLTDYKLMPLTCVYRQSNKLLKLAWELYNHFVGEPPFESAFENDDNDPDPIIYKRNDDTKFKQWLTKRILEIYKITDGRATIALFVSEDSEIDPLYDIINESLNNENLEVSRCKGGEILGTNSKIRIYSVEFIKGLEFEAVFFIDLDEIYLRKPALVDKYLYVGLTRAGSFLGVTYKNKFPGPLDFIKSYFSEGDWSWLAK
jgi:superfamily I DNA/RNA helicase